MNKKISMHQSSFLPYLGFWDKVRYSDKFMICNYYEFSSNEMYQRTFVEDGRFLTVPIDRDAKLLKDVKINHNVYNEFIDRFRNYMFAFKRYKNYNLYLNRFLELIDASKKVDYLIDLNMMWFLEVYHALKLNTQILFDKPSDLKKTERIHYFISDKDIYCTGSGGRNYLDTTILKNPSIMIQNNIEPLEFNGNILYYLFKYSNDEIFEIMNNKYKWEDYK